MRIDFTEAELLYLRYAVMSDVNWAEVIKHAPTDKDQKTLATGVFAKIRAASDASKPQPPNKIWQAIADMSRGG